MQLSFNRTDLNSTARVKFAITPEKAGYALQQIHGSQQEIADERKTRFLPKGESEQFIKGRAEEIKYHEDRLVEYSEDLRHGKRGTKR